MQTFNFFLISAAFLFAAYGTLLAPYPWAAAAIALMGTWCTFWFSRLDARTKELIKAGERALQACEEKMVPLTGIVELQIVRSVEKPGPRVPTYRTSFNNIEWSIGVVFLVGAAYAVLHARCR